MKKWIILLFLFIGCGEPTINKKDYGAIVLDKTTGSAFSSNLRDLVIRRTDSTVVVIALNYHIAKIYQVGDTLK
jgi:hypothetical protein